MSEHEPRPYTAPRRVVALCYQSEDRHIASTGPILGSACAELTVRGSAGGLVVAELPQTSDAPFLVAHLSAVLGVQLSPSPPFAPLILPTPEACSPAAAYPPAFGTLRVQLLTTSAAACEHVQQLINHHRHLAQHLLPPHSIPSEALQASSDLAAYIEKLLRRTEAEASVLVVHVTHEALAGEQSGADDQLLPPLLDDCLGQLLQQVDSGRAEESTDGPLSDVYLAAIRLQPLQYTSPLASTPLASFVPTQSYQLSVPSASSTSALYLPLLSFHHNTTRSDACLHPSPPQQFVLGSGGLIGATDWLAELAFRLGGKAKYGA